MFTKNPRMFRLENLPVGNSITEKLLLFTDA